VLEDKIRAARQHQDILLMTHLVLGTPSFDDNRRLIAEMVGAGVELIELQIPFSEPMADGPVIMKANDEALKKGTRTSACLKFAAEVTAQYPETSFLFMTYANIVFAYGTKEFVAKAAEVGIRGLIVPDLPPEEGADYLSACDKEKIDPVFIFTPTSTPDRLAFVASKSRGLVYGVGRKGVTGTKTTFDDSVTRQIDLYRQATRLPLAIGFGIQSHEDVQAIKGHADIAVLGTKILSLNLEQGAKAVGLFLKGLR
jgi:tryptophan synthase alpha chain